MWSNHIKYHWPMRTHQLVLQWIENQLSSGELALGGRLPAERTLAEQLHGGDPGAPALLAAYAEARREDRERTLAFSDGLARATANEGFPMHVLRSFGLLALGQLPGLAAPLAAGAMGFRGQVPALSRGRA